MNLSSPAELSKAFRSLETQEKEVAAYLADPKSVQGIAPWSAHEMFFGFRPNRVTLILGMNHSGKTTLTTQLLLRLLSVEPESRAMLYSPEMSAVELSIQLARQGIGGAADNAFSRRRVHGWLSHRLWHVDPEHPFDTRGLCEHIEYAAWDRGVKWVAVDSLMTMRGIRVDDLEAQKEFMRSLIATSRSAGVHIILLAHVRKPAAGSGRATFDRYDIRGAGELTDMVDNVLLLKRLKHKDGDQKHYQILCRDKERNSPGRTVDEVYLEFDQASQQFNPTLQTPGAYVPEVQDAKLA